MSSNENGYETKITNTELGEANIGLAEGLGMSPSTEVLFKQSLKKKFQMPGKILGTLVVLLLFCVVLAVSCIILAVFLAQELGKETKTAGKAINESVLPKCSTPECLEIAATFMRNTNLSLSPCEDFFRYSCEGWNQANPIPPSANLYNTFDSLFKGNSEKLREILENNNGLGYAETSTDNDAVPKTKRYYRSCLNEQEVERTSLDILTQMMLNYGSWSLNSIWNTTAWNWTENLMKIQKSNPLKSPLFLLSVAVNPRISSKYIIQVSWLDFGFHFLQYVDIDMK